MCKATLPVSLLALLGVTLAQTSLFAQESKESIVVYQSNFAKGVDPNWSGFKKVNQNKRLPFLGDLHNETVTLRLKKLAEHQCVRLAVDLMILRSWDGSIGGDGPDTIKVQVKGGPTLLHASFACRQSPGGPRGPVDAPDGTRFMQSYPDPHPGGRYPHGTGTREKDLKGISFPNALYHLEFAFPHTAREITLSFSGELKENYNSNLTAQNEAWGLASVRVSLSEAPDRLSQQQFDALWKQLDEEDPVKAQRALWALAGAGSSVLPWIDREAPFLVDRERAKLLGLWITELDAEEFDVRERATEKLVNSKDSNKIPLLRRVLEGDPSPEANRRIRHILAKVKKTKGVVNARLRQLIQVIGGKDRERLLARIPPEE